MKEYHRWFAQVTSQNFWIEAQRHSAIVSRDTRHVVLGAGNSKIQGS